MADKVEPLGGQKKRVSFADVADIAIYKSNFPEQYKAEEDNKMIEDIKKINDNNIIRSLIKSIYESSPNK